MGVTHIVIVEAKSIFKAVKEKKIKLLLPLAKRALYPALGLALVLMSFAIVNTILASIVPESISIPDHSSIQVKDFWTTMKSQTEFAGLFSTIGFVIAGISLILSAGGRWLVNLAKFFVTISVFYLFFSVLIAVA